MIPAVPSQDLREGGQMILKGWIPTHFSGWALEVCRGVTSLNCGCLMALQRPKSKLVVQAYSMFSGERGKSTSRGQFIPRIAAASCAGCSGACHPSDAWSWLEPSLLKVTVLAQVLRLRIGCCIAMQSVSKTVSADSLTSVFLQVFPS